MDPEKSCSNRSNRIRRIPTFLGIFLGLQQKTSNYFSISKKILSGLSLSKKIIKRVTEIFIHILNLAGLC